MADKKKIQTAAVLFLHLKGLAKTVAEGGFADAERAALSVLDSIYPPLRKWSGEMLGESGGVLAVSFGPDKRPDAAVLNAAGAGAEMLANFAACGPAQEASALVKAFSVAEGSRSTWLSRRPERPAGYAEAAAACRKLPAGTSVAADIRTASILPAGAAGDAGKSRTPLLAPPARPFQLAKSAAGGVGRESLVAAILSARAMREEGALVVLDLRIAKAAGKETEEARRRWESLSAKLSEDLAALPAGMGGEVLKKGKTQITAAFRAHSPASKAAVDAADAALAVSAAAGEAARRSGVSLRTAGCIAASRAPFEEISQAKGRIAAEVLARALDMRQNAVSGYTILDADAADLLRGRRPLLPGRGEAAAYLAEADCTAVLRAEVGERSDEGLVGRHAEMGLIRKAVNRMTEGGSGMVISFVGEEGWGKTRLAFEAIQLARESGVAAYYGSCRLDRANAPLLPVKDVIYEMTGLSPFGFAEAETDKLGEWLVKRIPLHADTIHKAFRTLLNLPGRKNPVDDYLPRLKLGVITKSILTYLESEAALSPMLLVFDDLHLAIKDTLDMVARIEDLCWKHGITVMKTSVPAVRLPVGPGEVRMNLRKLSQGETFKIAKTALGAGALGRNLSALLCGLDGSPGAAAGAVQRLAAFGRLAESKGKWDLAGKKEKVAVPDRDALAAALLRKAPKAAAKAAEQAAFLGRTFSAGLFAAVTGGGGKADAGLRAMVDSGIAVVSKAGDPREYTFASPATFRHIVSSTEKQQAKRLFGRAAEALSAVHGDRMGEHTDKLVLMLGGAGQKKQLGGFLTNAAIVAKNAGLYGLAEEYFTEAMDLYKEDNVYEAWLIFEFAGLLCQTGRNDRAIEILKDALGKLGKTIVFSEYDDRFDAGDLESEDAVPADGEPEPVAEGEEDGDEDEEDEDTGGESAPE